MWTLARHFVVELCIKRWFPFALQMLPKILTLGSGKYRLDPLSPGLHSQSKLRKLLRPENTVLYPMRREPLPGIQERQIKIQTCGSLYRQWQEEKSRPLFRYIFDEDLILTLDYVDTLDQLGGDRTIQPPTAVLVHGLAESYHDFEPLIRHLTSQGVRVIAPSFPNITVYCPLFFHHSDEEHYHILRDFLDALQISQVDIMVCHSAAVYSTVLFYQEAGSRGKLDVRSMAFINPAGPKIPANLKPIWPIFQGLMYCFQYRPGEKILKKLVGILNQAIGGSRTERFSDPQLYLFVSGLANSRIRTSGDRFRRFASRFDRPVLVAYSEKDRLIERESSNQLISIFKGSSPLPPSLRRYDREGNLISTQATCSNLEIICFESSSHRLFCKYPKHINEAVMATLRKSLEQEKKL